MGARNLGKVSAQIGDPDGRNIRAARLFMSRAYHWQPSEMDNMDALDFLDDFHLAQELLNDK